MPRSGPVAKRILKPDPIYNSKLVTRFINKVMMDGKKTIAQNLVYQAFKQIEEQSKKNPLTVFETAVANVAPKMEVKPKRIGGASYQIPVEVRGDRREALAIRWIIESARKRTNKEYKTFDLKLAAELIDASEGQGNAIKKKEDTIKSAEANKAFSHFRF
ncbi:MAG: 30S ribosomal protein S7 [Candidatus Daviesbacteria bacterium]|nr:30S ribosomal protein S7 [Candidatus Daviesbacteria bacterium]